MALRLAGRTEPFDDCEEGVFNSSDAYDKCEKGRSPTINDRDRDARAIARKMKYGNNRVIMFSEQRNRTKGGAFATGFGWGTAAFGTSVTDTTVHIIIRSSSSLMSHIVFEKALCRDNFKRTKERWREQQEKIEETEEIGKRKEK